MSVSERMRLVLCTCPDRETALSLAETLVGARLAACVNVVPGLVSVYRWQGRVEQAGEHLLLVKTTRERYPDVEAMILSKHPYELPEIVAVPVSTSLPAYLSWLLSAVDEPS